MNVRFKNMEKKMSIKETEQIFQKTGLWGKFLKSVEYMKKQRNKLDSGEINKNEYDELLIRFDNFCENELEPMWQKINTNRSKQEKIK